MNRIKVLHTNGEIEDFKPRLIGQTIIKETGIDEEIANRIQSRITSKINKLKKDGLTEISTGTIRAEVSSQLLKEREFEAEGKNRKLGMSMQEFEDLLANGNKDNANIFFSPELVAKYAYDSIAKEHALLSMPQDCSNAHTEGYIHCLSANNKVIVKHDNQIKAINIVELIDDLENSVYYVPSLNKKTEKVEWKKVTDGACTGMQDVYELEFSKGYKIECTKDHKFLRINSKNHLLQNPDVTLQGIQEKGSYRIAQLNKIPYKQNKDNYSKSALYGFFLGDGTISGKRIVFHLVKKDKINYIINLINKLEIEYKINDERKDVYISIPNLYDFNKEKDELPSFEINYKGLLEGLINSDGYITQHGGNKTNYLEFDSTNEFIMDLYIIALFTQGIRGSYRKFPRGEGRSDIYRSVIQNNNVNKLLNDITLRDDYKIVDIDSRDVFNISQLSPKKITKLGKQLVYNITVEDNHNYMAGTQGFILTQNCHDLEYFQTRSNCANWSIPFIARNGLKIDGKGEYGSVAGPAKSIEVLLNQMLEFLMCGSLVLSGGQSYSSFNVYLAPFAKGRTYKDIKQAIQNFIFNSNCALIAKGQTIFSSINIEFEVPDFLKNEPAVGPNGVEVGVYGDYEDEVKMIFKAIIEVTKEKDYNGRFHTFPNQIYMIRENTLDTYNEEVKMVHELLSENPTIYFSNVSKEDAVTMGCRTRMSKTFTGDYEQDCMNVGNFHYVSINLPLIAHESSNKKEFFDTLRKYMEISREVLLERKKWVEDTWYNKHMSDFLLQKDIKTGKQLYEIERCSFSIGICGLNECCLELTGNPIQDEQELGEEICQYMTDVLNEFKAKDGLRWTLFYSPAESAAHRFALINKEKYPDAYVNGTEGNYYLTNSHHIDVKSDVNLVQHIKNGDIFHKYGVAGGITHIWMSDTRPDPIALFKLNQRIAKTNIKFWAFTNDYTYCLDCGFTILSDEDECLICHSDNVVTLSRITGYYQPVSGYNNGKKQEFKDRYRHKNLV